DAASRGEASGDMPMQYADLSEWYNQLLEDEDFQQGVSYWREQGLDGNPALTLPFERQGSAVGAFNPQMLPFALSPTLSAGIEAFCDEHNIRPSTFFSGCWSVLISRLTGTPNPLIGVVYDGRSYAELENVQGPFARCLPLRAA